MNKDADIEQKVETLCIYAYIRPQIQLDYKIGSYY